MEQKFDLAVLRHSAAHLAAHAIVELFPGTKLTIGPATETGFFYDILPAQSLKEEDLSAIQERMFEISKRNYPIEHRLVPKEEARRIFKDNPFKLELIDGVAEDTVGLAVQGDWVDLCRGGHVETTGQIQHFTLLGLSGAYWRADKNKQALQRVSGTAFFTREDLEEFLRIKEELKKYDHRTLGKQLDMFSFHDEGPGFPFYHPKGKMVLNGMINFLRSEQQKLGYQEVQTPMILNEQLWHRSGHWQFYKDNMFFCNVEETTFAVKPMNCPGAFLIFGERPRSYRELPLRMSEFGLVHRNELSGALHGLFRVRAFTVDDAHIFITPEQIQDEVQRTITLLHTVLKKYGLENVQAYLSTKPAKAMGDAKIWELAESGLKNALNQAQIPYILDEGGGAFYGPKIDFKFTDSLKRQWQCGTIQLDFFQPENFDLTYVASSGKKERPVIIHRALYGSLERFFAVLLEHYKGALPFWLSPVQARVLTITNDQLPYAQSVTEQLQQAGIRAEASASNEQISAKIRDAQLEKIPWMIVVGKKEVEQGTVTLRHLDGKQEFGLSVAQLIERSKI